MPFPNLAGKHAHEAFFDPRDIIDYARTHGMWEDFPLPDGVIFTYSPRLLDRVLSRERAERRGRLAGELYLVTREGGMVGLCGRFGIGSAIATTLMEELVAVGLQRFVSIGLAGGLQKDLAIGDLVLCERAIRDEGVSHHYLAPAKYAYPSAALSERLGRALAASGAGFRVGTSWTIDAPYRETVEELRQYRAEGVQTVEMEAAGLAAVAEHRGVEFATAFTISDSLADLVWNPQFWAPETERGLDMLYEAAVAALTER